MHLQEKKGYQYFESEHQVMKEHGGVPPCILNFIFKGRQWSPSLCGHLYPCKNPHQPLDKMVCRPQWYSRYGGEKMQPSASICTVLNQTHNSGAWWMGAVDCLHCLNSYDFFTRNLKYLQILNFRLWMVVYDALYWLLVVSVCFQHFS